MLDVKRLRTFLTAAAEGSFTGAAKALYMTHSAVSQQMAILEREVGLTLIERSSKGITLTDAGRLLADRATTLLGMMASVETELADLRRTSRGVRIGAYPTAVADLIPRVLQEFRRRYPETVISFLPFHVNEMPDRLRDGMIHVGLAWEYNTLPRSIGNDIETIHLFDEPMDLLLPTNHGLAGESSIKFEAMADEQWIIRRQPPPYDRVFANLCQGAGFAPKVLFTTDDYQSIHGFVGAGLGVSVVPRLSLQVRHADVVAVPIDAAPLARRVMILTMAEAPITDETNKLFEVLRSCVDTRAILA